MNMDFLTIVAIGVFLGVFTRTMFPYLKKLKDAQDANQQLPFDKSYVVTALFSAITSIVATMFIIPTFEALNGPQGVLFAQAFTTGFTANALINEIVS